MKAFAGLLALWPSIFHSKSIFCLAADPLIADLQESEGPNLCQTNPDICEFITGGYYSDYAQTYNRDYLVYKPAGKYACPPEGCPLFIWLDGTSVNVHHTFKDQFVMLEMVKRGFVAVDLTYDPSFLKYGWDGCGGVESKAQAMFDESEPHSALTKLCDGPDALANCDLGVATSGWSQGAQIASLAGNYGPRVSASLLWGNGNHLSFYGGLTKEFECVNDDNLELPRERRRTINGSGDEVYGTTLEGVLEQQKETSGFDCGDTLNCFTCSQNSNLNGDHCPVYVPDTYIGGGAMIEDTAGYYVVSADEYCRFMDSEEEPCDSAPHRVFQDLAFKNVKSDFAKPETEWGLHQNLDWLASTARKTSAALELSAIISEARDGEEFFSYYFGEETDELV